MKFKISLCIIQIQERVDLNIWDFPFSDEFCKIYTKSPIGETYFFTSYATPEFYFENKNTRIYLSENNVMTRFSNYSATYIRETTLEEKDFYKKCNYLNLKTVFMN